MSQLLHLSEIEGRNRLRETEEYFKMFIFPLKQQTLEMAILPHVERERQIGVSCRIDGLDQSIPDAVSGSACSPLIKSTMHPNYPQGQSVRAENIKRSSCGILTLKRIEIVYGKAVQFPISSSISRIHIYVPHADLSKL
ncbi:MAG: hypothetical protein EZS28_048892 [Streblomastix strix]|uniref:Uncharacterized protein n=1 Tax=Streblomastix strix TaxID=222440 RepID=A0A5J4TD72_9EUKA|nr:MAG: hypothetical protein EZS28_048892 [Streblomastix strix]